MKRLAVLVLLILTWVASASAETMYVNVSYGSKLNVRDWPSATADIIGSRQRGDAVTAVQTEDGWIRCERITGNRGGWIKAEYLSTEQPEMKPTGKYTVESKNKVLLRKKPNGAKVMRLDPGKVVTVLGWVESEGVLWAKVKGGVINAEYLKEVEGNGD